MSELIFTSSNSWLYFIGLITCLYFIIKYKEKFNVEDIVSYFIYMTNRVNLILLFFMFTFMFIFSLADFTNPKIIDFFKEISIGLVFYSFFSYAVYFGILLIPKIKTFFKDNDLFTYSLYSKGGALKEK